MLAESQAHQTEVSVLTHSKSELHVLSVGNARHCFAQTSCLRIRQSPHSEIFQKDNKDDDNSFLEMHAGYIEM